MALVCKCDRCGNLFKPDNDGVIPQMKICSTPIKEFGKFDVIDNLDLCHVCLASLRTWLDKDN